MKLVRVEEIPKINHHEGNNQHNLIELLEDFIESDMKCARVELDPGEYSSAESARMSLVQTCDAQKYRVVVRFRAGSIYLGKMEV